MVTGRKELTKEQGIANPDPKAVILAEGRSATMICSKLEIALAGPAIKIVPESTIAFPLAATGVCDILPTLMDLRSIIQDNSLTKGKENNLPLY